MEDEILKYLQKYYGYKNFREGQRNIIDTILDGKDTLAIMPTGGGKSLCYQIPSMFLEGITIVVSPLISLMKDQVDTLKSNGINSAYINSTLSIEKIKDIIYRIKNKEFKIIYIAPERIKSEEFIKAVNEIQVSHIAIDEAHCVSQWGHDFRTSYRKIAYFIQSIKSNPVISAFTATASKEVRDDIKKLLELRNPKVFITGFKRENLFINIVKGASKKDYIVDYINKNKGNSGIIYCATRKEVDNLYSLLNNNNCKIGKYHGGLSDKERACNQEDFKNDNIDIMIATNAFGMGIDKPNVRYVIHYNMPGSIEGYYQEIGRAGRDGLESECILLFAPGDIQIQKYLVELSIENEERKNLKFGKIQQMADLVYTNYCYQKYILSYFGESDDSDCNKCSNCTSEGEEIDKTIDTQKVLSCIFRMKRPFGSGMVIDVLRGSKNKRIIDFKFNELTTYGIMKDYSNEELKVFVNTLVSHKYIDYVEGTYPVLKLNERSLLILKGKEKVLLKEIKAQRQIKKENELYILLSSLRMEIAKNEKKAPYMIFGDATLREMSIKYPMSQEELLSITGIGTVKADRYGNEFVKVIGNYVIDKGIKKDEVVESENLDNEYLSIETDRELLNKLIEFRKDIATRYNVFEPNVISLDSLKEISGRYPANLEELMDIGGIGPKKIDKYGEKIVNLVLSYVESKQIERNWVKKGKRKVVIDGEGRSHKEIALDELKEGKGIEEISNEIEISISTILGYLTEYIEETKDIDFTLDLDKYYTNEEREKIINICDKIGYNSISKVKKELPEYIKYESIRAIILRKYYNM